MRVLTRFALSTLIVVGLSSTAFAQPGGEGRGGWGGGGPGGGGPGGGGWGGGSSWGGGGPGGGGPGGGFDPSSFLSRLDRNGNGQLDPDEMSDRMRQFMGPRLEQAGFDLNQPIPLSKLTEAMQRAREGGSSNDSNQNSSGSSSPSAAPSRLVPGFGETVELTLVPRFDAGVGGAGPIEGRYDSRIVERVDMTMRRYDANQDGILSNEEIQRGRWSNPSWEESDTNSDGRLTRQELADRYLKREQQGGDDRGRGGENSRGDRGSENGRGGWPGGGPGGPGGPPPGGPGGGEGAAWSGRSRGGEQEGSEERERGSEERGSDSSMSRTSSERSSSRSSTTDPAALKERYDRYVSSIFGSRDADGNGSLSFEEAGRIAKPEELTAADTNGDKELSKEELVTFFVQRATGGSSSSSRASTSSSSSRSSSRSSDSGQSVRSVYTRLGAVEKLESVGVSSSFIETDTNHDGQIQMSEFARRWTQAIYDEFQNLDENGDGVLSAAEFTNR